MHGFLLLIALEFLYSLVSVEVQNCELFYFSWLAHFKNGLNSEEIPRVKVLEQKRILLMIII